MFHCRSIECQSVSDLSFGGRNLTDEFFVYLLSRNRRGACLTNKINKKSDFAFVLIYLAFNCVGVVLNFIILLINLLTNKNTCIV